MGKQSSNCINQATEVVPAIAAQSEGQHIKLDAHIVEQLNDSSSGHAVRVTVIQGGRSKNGYAYDEQVLREIARLIEGAQAYADHSGMRETTLRSVRDIIGFYHDAHFLPASSASAARVDA